MNNVEINRGLALAIGYRPEDIWVHHSGAVEVTRRTKIEAGHLVLTHWFDYMDWRVIGPIAEKYKLMPCADQRGGAWHVKSGYFLLANSTCPRACIALAVIEAAERGLL